MVQRSIIILFFLLGILNAYSQKILKVGSSVAKIGTSIAKSTEFTNTKYMMFDGSDEAITFASTISMSDGWTFSAWINPDSYSTKGVFGVSTGATDYCRFPAATTVYSVMNTTAKTITHRHTFTTGAWQLFIFVCNVDGVLSIYRNNVAPTGTQTTNTTTQINQICKVSAGANYYQGSMDQVCIWDRPLTSTEMTALYGGGTPQTSGDPRLIPNLRLFYSFDNVTSFPTIPDNSTRGNNGTSVNGESDDIVSY